MARLEQHHQWQCTTNFLEKLDWAALRRFSFKIGFDYLTPDQRFALFQEYLPTERQRLLNSAETAKLRTALSRLDNLTAGDFAPAIQRMDLFCQTRSIEGLLCALREEFDLKPDSGRKRVGFLG